MLQSGTLSDFLPLSFQMDERRMERVQRELRRRITHEARLLHRGEWKRDHEGKSLSTTDLTIALIIVSDRTAISINHARDLFTYLAIT